MYGVSILKGEIDVERKRCEDVQRLKLGKLIDIELLGIQSERKIFSSIFKIGYINSALLYFCCFPITDRMSHNANAAELKDKLRAMELDSERQQNRWDQALVDAKKQMTDVCKLQLIF